MENKRGRKRTTILDETIRSGVIEHQFTAQEIHFKICAFYEVGNFGEPMPSYRTIARRVAEIKREIDSVNCKG